MSRFEDTPGLFGVGIGHSTSCKVRCGWCGKVYEEDHTGNKTVGVVDFGNIEIGECCFEKVENAVLQKMCDILPWFKKILIFKGRNIEGFKKSLHKIKEIL